MKKAILAAAAAALTVNAASAQPVAEYNGILGDVTGRTLYVRDQDAANISNCNGACAAAWPPLLADDGETARAGFDVVMRDDVSRQWSFGGKPLYYFAADARLGDAHGDGKGGVWHVIRSGLWHSGSKPAAPDPSTGSDGSPAY